MRELVKMVFPGCNISNLSFFFSFSHSSAIFKFSIVSRYYFITWKTTGFKTSPTDVLALRTYLGIFTMQGQ